MTSIEDITEKISKPKDKIIILIKLFINLKLFKSKIIFIINKKLKLICELKFKLVFNVSY